MTDFNQNPYRQNPQQYQYRPPVQNDMTVGSWIVTFLLMCIPAVNVILILVWAFGSGAEKPSRKTWAQAQILIFLIGVVITVVLSVLFGVSLSSLMES